MVLKKLIKSLESFFIFIKIEKTLDTRTKVWYTIKAIEFKVYINCLKKLREFRKNLKIDKDIKRGRLYFTWIKDKTEIISNEKDENYIYTKVIKYTLPNYVITQYIFNKANKNVKSIIKSNYAFKDNKYTFNNTNISIEDVKILMKYVLFKRGNVIWIDFGFNIGNEFGGMHPAVILKNFDKDLFVVPISSKKPVEYVRIEKELEDGKINIEEYKKQINKITEIIELEKINGFRKMLRWARITRMKKISMLRVNFSGTIGTLDGKDMNNISDKICLEFGTNISKSI